MTTSNTDTPPETPNEIPTTDGVGLGSAPCSLFRVIVLHAAPKDQHTSTETYLVAKDEEEVVEWINKEKKWGDWFLDEEDEEPSMRFADDDYEKEIPFRDWVMKNRGDLTDDEGWDDAYYGVTKWGWEPIEASQSDIETLKRLGVAIEVNVSDKTRPSNPND